MNIIIEGPDGAGKTTLAKGFTEYTYHHEGPPGFGYDLLRYYTNLVTNFDNYIFDRHALSELVYGPILRGGSRITIEEVEILYKYKMAGDRLIICLPPPQVCYDNWVRKANAGDELFDNDDIFWRVYSAYGYYANRLNRPTFDYTTASHLEYKYLKGE